MRVLLIHPNFPAQLRHVAAALGRDAGNVVVFATKNPRHEWTIPGVSKVLFTPNGGKDLKTHRLAEPFHEAVLQGEAMHRVAYGLKERGFTPDVIYANSGWGASMYLRDIWPDAPLMCYFEWFYDPRGEDSHFASPPQAPGQYEPPSLSRTRNSTIFNDLWECDQGLSPTHWQRSQFPENFRDKIAVLHDGVDMDFFSPPNGTGAARRGLALPGLDLTKAEEVVTFAGRGMEPYRGFPQFMKAAEILLKERPGLHVVVAGNDRVCYGPCRTDGKTWKQFMLETLDLDTDRLHFVGSLPYGLYRDLLRATHAHVYLTRPFVLSWSFIEAMACGCPLAASDTSPVREAATHGENALLFDFHDVRALADRVRTLLNDRALAASLGAAARRTAVERYDLKSLLPRHLALLWRTASRA
ncbi:glycosyltransferase [Desulfocurvus sp. DL9XJH121]